MSQAIEARKVPPLGVQVDGIVGEVLEKKGFVSLIKGAGKLGIFGGVFFLLNSLAGTEAGHWINEAQQTILADSTGPWNPDFLEQPLTDQQIFDNSNELFGTDASTPLHAASAYTGLFVKSICMHVNGITLKEAGMDSLVVALASGALWGTGKVIHGSYKNWERKNI
jgi:hypothetical protein